MLERLTEELHVRRAEAHADWEVLQEAAARAEKDKEERRRLEAENAGWRRQQAEEQAARALLDARLAELARVLANCEEILAEAKYVRPRQLAQGVSAGGGAGTVPHASSLGARPS